MSDDIFTSLDDIFTPLTNMPTHNQRKSVRYHHKDLMAHLIVKQRFKSNEYTYTKVINISSSGAHISTGRKLPVKTKITLNLMLPNQTTYKVTAKIARICKNASYGVTFDETQHALIDHIMVHYHNFTIV